MQQTQGTIQDGMIAGSLASVLSTVVLALAGRKEAGSAYAPTNAVSHWLWGAPALHKNQPSWRHTAIGYAIHHGSALMWAMLHARLQSLVRERAREQAREAAPGDSAAALPDQPSLVPLLGTTAAVTALASLVDLKVAPERLHPGFEHRLSRPALVAVYAAFGLGLVLPYLMMRPSDRGK
jgi:hypothetical protein